MPVVPRLHRLIAEQGDRLEQHGIESGRAEIEWILCHLLKLERLQLYLHGEQLLNDDYITRLATIVEERLTRRPLQYILGESFFYGRRFEVNPAVLIPTPETELLCELAVRFCAKQRLSAPSIVDLGVGSGVIAVTLALELPGAELLALDISPEALDVACANAERLGGAGKIRFLVSDYFANVGADERFDVILANPPYIREDEYPTLPAEVRADPTVSLVSGPDGLDAIRTIIRDAHRFLAPGGRIMFEFGYGQAAAIVDLVKLNDLYTSHEIVKDLNGIERIAVLGCGG